MHLLRNYGDALEADFERYYHRDLVDLYRGDLSLRKALVLAINLPPGAMTWQEMGSDNAWAVSDHLLAQAVDALHAANWQRGGDGNKPQPDPVPRPSDLREMKDKRSAMLARASRFKQRTAERSN